MNGYSFSMVILIFTNIATWYFGTGINLSLFIQQIQIISDQWNRLPQCLWFIRLQHTKLVLHLAIRFTPIFTYITSVSKGLWISFDIFLVPSLVNELSTMLDVFILLLRGRVLTLSKLYFNTWIIFISSQTSAYILVHWPNETEIIGK